MKCRNCKREIVENSLYCNWCGAKQIREKKKSEIKVPAPVQRSGAWWIYLRKEGISITESTPEKCKAKAIAVRSGYLKEEHHAGKTLTKAIDDYIDSKSSVLSPETLRGYRVIQKYRFQDLMNKDCNEIDQKAAQRAVNKESEKLSPKSVKNAWFFISSVLRTVTTVNYEVRLPMQVPHEKDFLSAEQIPVFCEALKNYPEIEIFCLLALSSLRRSEIYGLRWEDIDLDNKQIHINGAVVYDENQHRVRKETNKNISSHRTVPIMINQLYEALENADKDNPVVMPCYTTVCRRMALLCEEYKLPRITPHELRHSFATLALTTLQMPENIVMEIGGWSDTSTMKKIYRHASQADINKRVQQLDTFFNGEIKKEQETRLTGFPAP